MTLNPCSLNIFIHYTMNEKKPSAIIYHKRHREFFFHLTLKKNQPLCAAIMMIILNLKTNKKIIINKKQQKTKHGKNKRDYYNRLYQFIFNVSVCLSVCMISWIVGDECLFLYDFRWLFSMCRFIFIARPSRAFASCWTFSDGFLFLFLSAGAHTHTHTPIMCNWTTMSTRQL